MDEETAEALATDISNWPTASGLAESLGESTPNSAHQLEILTDMVSSGILVDGVQARRFPVREKSTPALRTLIEGYSSIRCDISTGDVVRFLAASAKAAVLLRWKSLEWITARVSRRRLKHQANIDPLAIERLQRTVSIFMRLRPLVFTANEECLFNSLALSELLARHHFFPRWIFGVATEPFRAHCWLQQEDWVIDDTTDNVGCYTPIMVV